MEVSRVKITSGLSAMRRKSGGRMLWKTTRCRTRRPRRLGAFPDQNRQPYKPGQ